MEKIGGTLKNIRKWRNMTLETLAEKSTLSVSYLSKLERNLNSPTLLQLQKVCESLDVSFSEVIKENSSIKKEPENSDIVVKRNERKDILTLDEGLSYESLTKGRQNLEGVSITIPKDKFVNEMSWGHHSDEMGLVSEGTLDIKINDVVYTLNKGDTIYIHAHTPHSIISNGNESLSYWFFMNHKS